MRFLLALMSSAYLASASTWFVRPGVWTTVDGSGHPIPTAGVYGLQNGTSYVNAWNGITSIVWASMLSGDTLYVCGTHIYKIQFNVGSLSSQASTAIGVSGITIRMDYPGDTGLVFGGNLNYLASWAPYLGPDANGVYHQTLNSGSSAPPKFYINGTNIVRLKQRSATTWTDGLGGQYLLTQTNYVQIPGAVVPTTNNVAQAESGWAFDLNYQSNLTFQSCHFISAGPDGSSRYAIRHVIPVSPFTTAANHITFTNCTSFDSETFYLYPGEDSFSFYNCEFGRCAVAIYSLIHASATAPQNITVQRCWIHDTGTLEYPDLDGHAIGIQGGNYHYILNNSTSNTGPAIAFWTGNVDMKTNTIAYNYVTSTRTNSSGVSDGISISGDNALALAGRRLGNKIYGNIVRNVALGSGQLYQGRGISCNSPDYIEILNNTIYGGNTGIDIEVAIANSPANCKVVNNIVVNPAVNYFYIVGTVTNFVNLTVDYNLYSPATNLIGHATLYPNIAHDTHSVFADPLFAVVPPVVLLDFRTRHGSPAMGAGVQDGLTFDIIGTPISQDYPPDIGAFQMTCASPVVP